MSRLCLALSLLAVAMTGCQTPPTPERLDTSTSSVSVARPAFVFGSVAYGEHKPVPAGSELDIELVDVSDGEEKARVIATNTVREIHQIPVAFALRYDRRAVSERRLYGIRARLRAGGQIRYATLESHPVLTRGHSNEIPIRLFPVRADGSLAVGPDSAPGRRGPLPDPSDDV